MNTKQYKTLIENVVRRLYHEGVISEDTIRDEELTPFEEYQNDYPNDDFDMSHMTPEELANWCQSVGDFLYVYDGIHGLKIRNANTHNIVQSIVKDLHDCDNIVPTHEIDKLLYYRDNEFLHDYVCVFKIVGVQDGDYYIIYQQDKNVSESKSHTQMTRSEWEYLKNKNLQKIQETLNRQKHNNRKHVMNESAKNRIQVSRDQIIDILNSQDDNPGNSGKFASLTYVTSKPVYKTKRNWRADDVQAALDKHSDRSGEDWHKQLTAYNQEGAKGNNPIGAVIVTQRYVFHWHTQEQFSKDYADYSKKLSDLRMKNGIAIERDGKLGDNKNQRQRSDVGPSFNQTGNMARDFNMKNSTVKVTPYFVDADGNIVSDIPTMVMRSMQAVPSPKQPEKEVAAALQGEALEAYMKAKAELDKSYQPRNLLFDKILCIAANVNGQSYYYINDKILAPIASKSEVHVNQSDMVHIAEEQLGETFNEIM